MPVKVGTQQANAMEQIRVQAQLLGKLIAELCPEGESTNVAMQKAMEAKMWATQAISHRGT